jgi:hypothetical protein
MTDYLVTLNDPSPFSIDVNYQVPTKSIQYSNIILDSINSQFTGIAHTFGLSASGDTYYPINEQQLIVSLNDVILQPIQDFIISNSHIIFTNAPALTDNVFIIALATTADLTRTINYIVDSGSFNMLAGNKGSVTLDVSGIIESLTIFSDQQGDLTIDIKKSNYNDFPTFTSIVGGTYPQMFNSRKIRDDVLNNWDTTVLAGDIFTFDVISVNNIQRFLISLKLKL